MAIVLVLSWLILISGPQTPSAYPSEDLEKSVSQREVVTKSVGTSGEGPMRSATAAVCTLLLFGCDKDDGIVGPTDRHVRRAVVESFDTIALPISADTYLKQGTPNKNQGSEEILRIRASGRNRILLRVDQSVIDEAVGSSSIESATVELTITDLANNWSATGRTVDIHRMTQSWEELGATWKCADDLDTSNSKPDCDDSAWVMNQSGPNPWEPTATSTVTVANGQMGTVSFDVSQDVAAYVAGSIDNLGWIVKKTLEGQSGRADFGSNESGSPGRLLIVAGAQVPDTLLPPVPDTQFASRDTIAFPVTPPDSIIRLYRTVILVQFEDGATRSQFDAVLLQLSASVIGGIPGTPIYQLRIPDPGPTLDDLGQVLDSLKTMSGVRFAAPYTFDWTPRLQGRYPDEGQGMRRTDWFDGSDETWALRSIRAPEAWSCENGTYDATRVRIGILDFFFDITQQDIAPSSAQSRVVGTAGPLVTDPRLSTLGFTTHGTSVAAQVSAAGDDQFGTAGLVWESELYLYEFATGQQKVQDPITHFISVVMPSLLQNQVRILVTTMDIAAGRQGQVDLLENAFRQFAQAGGLIILAAGNRGFGLNGSGPSVVDLATFGPGVGTARAELSAAARLKLAAESQSVLITAGSEQSANGVRAWNRKAVFPDSGATNFFPGAVDIVAPGHAIRTSFSGGLVGLVNGTSFSAPMVAGVAAQLLSMDPTLSSAEVRDFILRGARASRFDPQASPFGAFVASQPVPGFPAGANLFHLDAYSALKLLSDEKPGSPVCGYPVTAVENSIVFHKPSGEVIHSLPGTTDGQYGPSVAPGGREIAVPAFGEVLLVNQLGTVTGTVSGVFERQYLEAGFADLLADDFFNLEVRVTDGSGAQALSGNLLQGLGAQLGSILDLGALTLDARVSPLGDEVVFDFAFLTPSCSVGFGEYVILRSDLNGQNLQTIRDFGCVQDVLVSFGDWDDRGNGAYVFTNNLTNSQTLTTVSDPSGVQTLGTGDLILSANLVERSRVLLANVATLDASATIQTCRRVQRNVDFLTIDLTTTPVPIAQCEASRPLSRTNAPSRVVTPRGH